MRGRNDLVAHLVLKMVKARAEGDEEERAAICARVVSMLERIDPEVRETARLVREYHAMTVNLMSDYSILDACIEEEAVCDE